MKKSKRTTSMKNKPVIILSILIVFLILGNLYFLLRSHYPTRLASQSVTSARADLQQEGQKILNLCKNAPHRPSCYDRMLPELMDAPSNLTMEEVFIITQQIQEHDNVYAYCHVLSHALSAKEVAKDPSKWKEVIPRCPTTTCSNGCFHGTLQERFKTDVLSDQQLTALIPDLQNICEPKNSWDPTTLDHISCYHGLGHSYMYITGADIHKSLELCSKTAIKEDGDSYYQTCSEGIFMQLYQPQDPEDIALVKDIVPQKNSHEAFCTQFSGQDRAACQREAWVLYSEELKDPSFLLAYCQYTTNTKEQNQCYNKMFFSVFTILNFDEEKMMAICLGLPLSLREQCYTDSVSRLITADTKFITRAIHFCSQAQESTIEDACFERLVEQASYVHHPESKAFYEYCATLPGKWTEQCLSHNNT